MDIGILPGILSGNIIGVIAQRLVRKLCPRCKEAYTPDEHEARILGADPENPPQIYRPTGCPACSQKGYKGRLALIEVLRMDPTLDELVASHAPLHDIRRAAFEHGYRPLAEDGLQRVRDGITSLDEVARVVDLTGRV
jgi:type II secretory ATPase GspE/PulE/Tfp pilus assembly ATPase PilB-like protein